MLEPMEVEMVEIAVVAIAAALDRADVALEKIRRSRLTREASADIDASMEAA